jgi:hypothetical protein
MGLVLSLPDVCLLPRPVCRHAHAEREQLFAVLGAWLPNIVFSFGVIRWRDPTGNTKPRPRFAATGKGLDVSALRSKLFRHAPGTRSPSGSALPASGYLCLPVLVLHDRSRGTRRFSLS